MVRVISTTFLDLAPIESADGIPYDSPAFAIEPLSEIDVETPIVAYEPEQSLTVELEDVL